MYPHPYFFSFLLPRHLSANSPCNYSFPLSCSFNLSPPPLLPLYSSFLFIHFLLFYIPSLYPLPFHISFPFIRNLPSSPSSLSITSLFRPSICVSLYCNHYLSLSLSFLHSFSPHSPLYVRPFFLNSTITTTTTTRNTIPPMIATRVVTKGRDSVKMKKVLRPKLLTERDTHTYTKLRLIQLEFHLKENGKKYWVLTKA